MVGRDDINVRDDVVVERESRSGVGEENRGKDGSVGYVFVIEDNENNDVGLT